MNHDTPCTAAIAQLVDGLPKRAEPYALLYLMQHAGPACVTTDAARHLAQRAQAERRTIMIRDMQVTALRACAAPAESVEHRAAVGILRAAGALPALTEALHFVREVARTADASVSADACRTCPRMSVAACWSASAIN